MLNFDWLTTRVALYSILIGCRELRVFDLGDVILDSDWLPRAETSRQDMEPKADTMY